MQTTRTMAAGRRWRCEERRRNPASVTNKQQRCSRVNPLGVASSHRQGWGWPHGWRHRRPSNYASSTSSADVCLSITARVRGGKGRVGRGGGGIPTLPPALENTQWNWPRYSIPSNAVRKNVSGLIVDYLGRRVQIVSAGISILVCRWFNPIDRWLMRFGESAGAADRSELAWDKWHNSSTSLSSCRLENRQIPVVVDKMM